MEQPHEDWGEGPDLPCHACDGRMTICGFGNTAFRFGTNFT
jgi:hypothetical protein